LALFFITKFNTSKVTAMDSMFYNCSSLASLDLGKFDTSRVNSMSEMFYEMPNNSKIYTTSQSTKDWILGLPTSDYKPSIWTSDNIIVQ